MDATNDVSAARPLGTSLVVPPPADERTHIALTRPHPDVWLASLYAPPDNKLTATAMKQLSAVLDTVEAEWRQGEGESPGRGGAFVLTSSNPKFFSNGLGLPANPDLYPRFLSVLWEGLKWRLLTFPLLTIAAINGHAFGGGLLFALTCDVRLMTAGKGLLSINEVLIGMPLNAPDCALLRTRLPPGSGDGSYPGWAMRDVLLGKRWTQSEALAIGMIDEIVPGDQESLLERAVARGADEGRVVASGAYGAIKEGMYAHLKKIGEAQRRTMYPAMEAAAFWDRVGGKL